jgi:hypothetical protein
VQRGHGDAAQFGLGDIQAQVGADIDQPPRPAGQQMTGVVASVQEAGLARGFLPPSPPRGSRGRDCWPRCRIGRGQNPYQGQRLLIRWSANPLGGGHVGRDVDDALTDAGGRLAHDPVGGRSQGSKRVVVLRRYDDSGSG